MPSYHENCGKPGPKSLSWIPPPEARLFKSRSAPGSPLFDRNEHFSRSAKGSASFREPRHTRASFLMRESQMKKAEKYKNEKGAKIGRSKSFTSRITSKLYNRTEQKHSLGKSWHPKCLKCEECGKILNPGQHSEHRGIPYCNIPCYSLLFGPGGYGRGGVESHQKLGFQATLPPDQIALRNELLPKLRYYNEHYESDKKKALQLVSKEANGKLIIEGVLRVYWGLKDPVTLGALYWRNDRAFRLFHVVQSKKLSRSETMKQLRSQSLTTDEKVMDRPFKKDSRGKPRSNSDEKLARRHTLGHSDRKKRPAKSGLEPTRFIPPYGFQTTLRLTSKIPTPDVVKMILTKFQIADPCDKFSLFIKYENGEIKRLNNEDAPLMIRLRLGPAEDLAKIYIMEDTEENTIRREVAQYIHFATPVLQAFIVKFDEEEEREMKKIKDRYREYKKHLQAVIQEFSSKT
ncbi:ras association domain-containing protein 2-like isoform X2 [Dendronephthya gigantea]|nr:ras association domain-containing protein 2-like isoform X2 [Dendronephthya gigantea]